MSPSQAQSTFQVVKHSSKSTALGYVTSMGKINVFSLFHLLPKDTEGPGSECYTFYLENFLFHLKRHQSSELYLTVWTNSFPSLTAHEHSETPVPAPCRDNCFHTSGDKKMLSFYTSFGCSLTMRTYMIWKCLTCLSHASSAVCHMPYLHHHLWPVCDHTSCCFLPVPLY